MADEQIIVDIKVNANEIVAAEKAIDSLTTSIDSLARETSKLRAENKSNADTQRDLNKLRLNGKITLEEYKNASSKLNEITAQNNKKIAENNIELSKQKNERNANIKLIKSESSSRDQLRQKIALLTKEYNGLNQSTSAGKQRSIELQKELHKLNTELNKGSLAAGNFKDNVGNYSSAFSRFGKSLKDLFIGGGIVAGIMMIGRAVKDLIQDSFRLGQQMGGTKMQFDKLNDPSLLSELRKATGGTVTDLELMKASLDADDFKINLKNLPLYFQYARKEVQETGGSVTDLVSNIVQGIGKESPKVLTQLGISTKDFQAELKKTGDYTTALNNIIKERMIEAGTYIETAADVTSRWSTRWENLKTGIGLLISEALVKLSPYIEKFVGWIEEAWRVSTTFILDFINGWIELYNESLAFRLLVESIGTTFTIVWETIKLFFNLIIDNVKNTGKILAYTLNPANWGEGFGKGLAKLLTETGSEVVGDIKKFGKNVGNAYYDGLASAKEGKKAKLTMSDLSLIGGGAVPGKEGQDMTGGGGSKIKKEPYDPSKDPEIIAWLARQKAAKEYADFLKLQDEEILKGEQERTAEELKAREEMDAALWQMALDDYERAEEKRKEENEKKLEQEKQLQEALRGLATGVGDIIANETIARFNQSQDEKINKIQEDAKIQEDILKSQLDNGTISEEDYQKKILALNKKTKTEEAKAERKKVLYEIGVNAILAAVKSLPNIFAFGATLALGLAKGIAVATRPLPEYGEGTSDIVNIGGSHASGNDVKVWGYSGTQKQYFGKVEKGEAMPVIRKSAVNDYMIAKLNGKFDSKNKVYANGSPDITNAGTNTDLILSNMVAAMNNIKIVAKIEDITKEAAKKMEIIDNSKM